MSELIKVGDEIQTVVKCVNCGKVLPNPLDMFGPPHLEQCNKCFLAGLEPSDATDAQLEKQLESILEDIDDTEDRIEDLEGELGYLEYDRDKLKQKIADRKAKLCPPTKPQQTSA